MLFLQGFCYECGLEILQKTEECHLCRKVRLKILLPTINNFIFRK